MGNNRPVTTLADKLAAPEVRPKVLGACETLIESEVQHKTGLAGMAVKTVYKIVKAIKPGIVRELVSHLLPEFTEALEPLHAESVEEAASTGRELAEVFPAQLTRDRGRTAEALLSVTDRRAQRAKNQTLKKAYHRLRGGAQAHVEAAVPGLARAIAPFV